MSLIRKFSTRVFSKPGLPIGVGVREEAAVSRHVGERECELLGAQLPIPKRRTRLFGGASCFCSRHRTRGDKVSVRRRLSVAIERLAESGIDRHLHFECLGVRARLGKHSTPHAAPQLRLESLQAFTFGTLLSAGTALHSPTHFLTTKKEVDKRCRRTFKKA